MNETNEVAGGDMERNIDNRDASANRDGGPAPMMAHPANVGRMNEDDISLPLSLIKGLRRKQHHGLEPSSVAKAAAMDSSTSSNNTSDKDDSGGDEEGGSNTSSTGKPSNGMTGTLSIGTFGQISSLSGSEQEGNSGRVGGILRVGGGDNNASFSSSSEGENITGDDELSERVVVRGKSVTSSQQYQQAQYKVSFAESHCSNRNGSDGRDQVSSPKRKRNQEKNNSSSTSRTDEENSTCKRQRMSDHQEFKNNSISFSDSNVSSGNERRIQQERQYRDLSVKAVSDSSSTTGSGGQPAGQASSSFSSIQQGTDVLEQDFQPRNDQLNSPLLSSKQDPFKFNAPKSPSSPSKNQQQHPDNSEERRLERNQREKERSNKIASQVDALRCLLQRGGLFIPKNTKSTVLSEASNYIQTLQDRQQMMSLEMENLKCQLVAAVSARGQQQQQVQQQNQQNQAIREQGEHDSSAQDYRLIFKNTMAGMCVASMGGALLDCNAAFESETGISQSNLSEMTIFNIIHANDLSRALDLISRMIDTWYVGQGATNRNQACIPQGSPVQDQQEPLLLRSAFHNRPDLGLCVMLVRGSDSVARCFGITLVKNVSSISGVKSGDSVLAAFNPSLPSIPSIPIESSAQSSEAPKPLPQPFAQPVRIPEQLNPITMSVDNSIAAFGNRMTTNNAATAPIVNLPQRPVVVALPSLQAPVLQASALLSQRVPAAQAPSACIPQAPPANASPLNSQQLMQLVLLSQQQLQPQMHQGQQQQQGPSPTAPHLQQQQQPSVFPVTQQLQSQQQQHFQQYQQQLSQMNQLPPQLQLNASSPAASSSVPAYWNSQNLAMFPLIQQILKPPGSNASSQGSNDGEHEDNGPAYYASG